MATKKVKKYANVFFQQTFQFIGGVETYLYEVIYKYHKLGYDVDLFYINSPNPKQIERIEEVIGKEHIHKWKGEIVYCHTLFFNYDFYSFIDKVIADEYINVHHANYLIQNELEIHDHPKITKRLGVSEIVCKAFKERARHKISLCYNPITIKQHDTDKVLTLVSATRLSKEKGGLRMVGLMKALDNAGIKYYWHIYTNDKGRLGNKNVVYHEPTLDIRPYLKNADYVVQLSDSEGYCYTILEALTLNTPVIVTDLAVFKEMGVANGKNGYVLSLDMKEIPVDEIYNKIPKFKYEPKLDNYSDYLYKGKTNTEEIEMINVKVISPFYDVIEDVHYVPEKIYGIQKTNIDGLPNKPVGTIFQTDVKRAKELYDLGLIECDTRLLKKRGRNGK